MTASMGVRKLGVRQEYHGMVRWPEYTVWAQMIARCENKKYPCYKNYGGRGIRVCRRWRTSFTKFIEDMGRRPTSLHSIDRKNNDRNYTPVNCVWATRAQQNRNHRRVRLIRFDGETMCLADWAKKLRIRETTLRYRVDTWPLKRALTEQVARRAS